MCREIAQPGSGDAGWVVKREGSIGPARVARPLRADQAVIITLESTGRATWYETSSA